MKFTSLTHVSWGATFCVMKTTFSINIYILVIKEIGGKEYYEFIHNKVIHKSLANMTLEEACVCSIYKSSRNCEVGIKIWLSVQMGCEIQICI
jgi:hypothetical protein